MAQILPPKTSLSNSLGQSIGTGLQQGIERGSEVGFQRGTLQNALSGLKDIPLETTPGQLQQKLIMATAGIPGAERYVPQLYEALQADLIARQKAAPGIGQTDDQRMGSHPAATNPQTQIPGSSLSQEQVGNILGEKYFPNIQKAEPVKSGESLKPQKPLMPPEPIGPKQEQELRAALRENGITIPAVIDDQIAKIKQNQKDIYAAQKEGFSNVEEYQKAKQERDKDFFAQADMDLGAAHGEMTPGEKNIWREMSRNFEDSPPTERFASTEQMYNQLVGNPLIQFEENQRGLPYGSLFRPEEIKNVMGDARTSVQSHLKKIDERPDLSPELKGKIKNQLREQYFNAMGSKDFGIAQAANAVYDLSNESKNSVPKAPSPKVIGIGGTTDEIYLADPKEREKFTYSLANAISKMSPEDSLILMREKALENNYDDKAFNQALNIALQSGKFKLSDFQSQEKPKLSIPQRLDLTSIMDGKRSVWDYFKRKQ